MFYNRTELLYVVVSKFVGSGYIISAIKRWYIISVLTGGGDSSSAGGQTQAAAGGG